MAVIPARRATAIVNHLNVFQDVETGLFLANARWVDHLGNTHEFSHIGHTAEEATDLLRAALDMLYGVAWTPQDAMVARPNDTAPPPPPGAGEGATAPGTGEAAPDLHLVTGAGEEEAQPEPGPGEGEGA